jgi:hypothetical protein
MRCHALHLLFNIYFFYEKQLYSTDFREIISPESLPINSIKHLISEIDIIITNCYQPKSQNNQLKTALLNPNLQNKHYHRSNTN